MKVKVKDIKEEKEKYPYLGVAYSDGQEGVILFTRKDTGTCLKHWAWEIGHYCEHWHEGAFEPFKGTIELKND